MADKPQWHEETIAVGDTELSVMKGGSGKALLVLHDELGYAGWLKWNSALARERSLIIPMHPGYGRTLRADWIMNVRDLAGFYQRFLVEQKLAPIDVVGFSFGGWVAAEMAANNPGLFSKMVLVAPAGIKPSEGNILDFFQMMAPDHVRVTVKDADQTPEFGDLYGGSGPEQFELWEESRAETARLAWQPFMHNPSLPHLLGVLSDLSTLLIWGKDDVVVPASAGNDFKRAIKGSKLVVFDGCGHRPEVEKCDDFVRETQAFLGK